MYMYIAMYFMYIVDTCKILIFMLNTCIYIYICIFLYTYQIEIHPGTMAA